MERGCLPEEVELHIWVKYLPCLLSVSAVPWILDSHARTPVEVKDLPAGSRGQQEEPGWLISVVTTLL